MNERYSVVFTHKELEIIALKVATPDKIGYFIDHYFFADRKYDLVQDVEI